MAPSVWSPDGSSMMSCIAAYGLFILNVSRSSRLSDVLLHLQESEREMRGTDAF